MFDDDDDDPNELRRKRLVGMGGDDWVTVVMEITLFGKVMDNW